MKILGNVLKKMKTDGWVKTFQSEVVNWWDGTKKKDPKKGSARPSGGFSNEHIHLSIKGSAADTGSDGATENPNV
jgi:hypothetical protein